MKIILNNSWGTITPETSMLRTNEELIELVESGKFHGRVNKYGSKEELVVVEIPDEATDYIVVSYDGVEGIFYCLGGRIYFIGSSNNCKIIDESSGLYY